MMRNILVTGGAGYIGSHIVQELADQGYNPITFDNLSQGHRDAVVAGEFVEGDLRNADDIRQLLSKHSIDAVIHMAASSVVSESVKKPAQYYENNVLASINLLKAMSEYGVRKIVFSSSAAVYGNPDKTPISEDANCNPTNPYGQSKLMFEKILLDAADIGEIDCAILRYFNVAGHHPSGNLRERHNPETHLIPRVIQSIQAGDPVEIYGDDYPTPDGTCVRDYIHVCDVARAHIQALKKIEVGSGQAVYNLGNGNGFSVREVIESIQKVIGKKTKIVIRERREGDPPILVADSSLAKKELDWHPQHIALDSIIPNEGKRSVTG